MNDTAKCPACKARGEAGGNVLRHGDNVYVHVGNHLAVDVYTRDMMYIDCPGKRPHEVDVQAP